MKRKFKLLLMTLLFISATFLLVGCKEKQTSGEKAPTKDDWMKVGITGSFTAEVKGKLVTNQAIEGEISMKWTESNEESLDNTIDFLKTQGYSSYNGDPAKKQVDPNASIINYIANKTVGAKASVIKKQAATTTSAKQ